MAKNKNGIDNVGAYLDQIEQDNRKLQSHTGLPWYRASKGGFNSSSYRMSLFSKISLIIFLGIIMFIFYKVIPALFIAFVVLGIFVLIMIYDANRKPRDND